MGKIERIVRTLEESGCQNCGCTARNPCEEGCEWDAVVASVGGALCTRCLLERARLEVETRRGVAA